MNDTTACLGDSSIVCMLMPSEPPRVHRQCHDRYWLFALGIDCASTSANGSSSGFEVSRELGARRLEVDSLTNCMSFSCSAAETPEGNLSPSSSPASLTSDSCVCLKAAATESGNTID